MKSSSIKKTADSFYSPGDPIMESQRILNNVNILGASKYKVKEKEDIPILREIMEYHKFTTAEIDTLVDAIQSTVSFVGGIFTGIGTVTSIIDLMGKLGIFGPQESETQVQLQKIGARLNQIYSYLADENIKGLHMDAVGWRTAQTNARNAIRNAQISPTISLLEALEERATDLDTALNMMLEPENAYIAFQRKVYGYLNDYLSQNHWINAATPPYMLRADGQPIHYRDPDQELASRIWDAGHYIDVLFSALSERILGLVTLEPAFRSTGYHREQLRLIATKLTAFINAWRASLLVANPAEGLNGGIAILGEFVQMQGAGLLQSPFRPGAQNLGSQSAPPGIVIGAIDPVTGIASWDPFWAGFETTSTVTLSDFGLFSEAWGGGYDYVQAKDPAKALEAVTKRQTEMLDNVISSIGITALVKLRAQFQALSAELTTSEFVDLPNAKFNRVKTGIRVDGFPVFAIRKGGEEWIDLGRLRPFAKDPDKKYKGVRHFQEAIKTFRFKMARRTTMTRIQLGYRLRLGDTDITLTPFSKGGFLDTNVIPFPIENIFLEISESGKSYEVRQSHVFSNAEEDLFEAGRPIPNNFSIWELPGWKGRIMENEKGGRRSLSVSIRFEYNPAGEAYSGEAIVSITNLHPEEFSDGFILPVQVFETHMNGAVPAEPHEYMVDNMTIQFVPSFLVMEPDYFNDRSEALAFMAKTTKEIDDRFSLQIEKPKRPDPDPAWAGRRNFLETMAMADYVDQVIQIEPEAIQDVINQFRPPAISE